MKLEQLVSQIAMVKEKNDFDSHLTTCVVECLGAAISEVPGLPPGLVNVELSRVWVLVVASLFRFP